MHVGVFVTGDPPEALQTDHGDYAAMMERLLRRGGETWTVYRVLEGQFPGKEAMRALDVIVVTGSKFDAHGTEEWIQKAKTVLKEAYEAGTHLIGICFGHQLIALALGGVSERGHVGLELGVQALEPTTALTVAFPDLALPLHIIQVHQDQVTRLPPDATLLASSPLTPIEIFRIRDQVLCIQGHPEFSIAFLHALIDARSESYVYTSETVDAARDSIQRLKPSTVALQQLIHAFMK